MAAAFAVITVPGELREAVGESPTTPDINSIAYGNGMFMAVGDDGWSQHSTDGLEWTGSYLNTDDWCSVVFGHGQFFAARTEEPTDEGRYIHVYSRSDNLEPWSSVFSELFDDGPGTIANPPCSLTFVNGRFFLVAGVNVLVSETGESWTRVLQDTYIDNRPPVVGKNRLILHADPTLYATKNGLDWDQSYLWTGGDAGPYSYSVRYQDGKFYASWSNRSFTEPDRKWYSSLDSISWTQIYSYWWPSSDLEPTIVGTEPDLRPSQVSVWGNGTLVTLRSGNLESTTAPPPTPFLFIEPDDSGIQTLWVECTPDVDWILQSRPTLDPATQWETISEFRTSEPVHSIPFESIATDATSSLFRVILAPAE